VKEKFLQFTAWAQKEWLAIVIFMVVIAMAFLCLVLLSWVLGYWLKALYGYNFELNSCWQGVSAVGAALGLIAALAKAAWTKYDTDSKYNSPPAEPIDRKNIVNKIREEMKNG
jgi:hypothetical protein